jgi:hypothetical protein
MDFYKAVQPQLNPTERSARGWLRQLADESARRRENKVLDHIIEDIEHHEPCPQCGEMIPESGPNHMIDPGLPGERFSCDQSRRTWNSTVDRWEGTT